MIEYIRTYQPNTFMCAMVDGACYLKDTIMHYSEIDEVTKDIFIQVILSTPLLCLHYKLFAVGFAFGFVFYKDTNKIVEQVNAVYQAQRTFREKIFLTLGGGFLTLYTLSTSIVFATLYYSSKWGARLYTSSVKRPERHF